VSDERQVNETVKALEAQEQSDDALLDALWGRVMEAWDEEKPHHALLEYAITQQKLPEIAGRYRAIKENDAERSARAQKKLDGIVIAATHLLMAMKTPASPQKVPTWVTAMGFVVCMILIGWVVRLVFQRH
jgi:hypothetical protein